HPIQSGLPCIFYCRFYLHHATLKSTIALPPVWKGGRAPRILRVFPRCDRSAPQFPLLSPRKLEQLLPIGFQKIVTAFCRLEANRSCSKRRSPVCRLLPIRKSSALPLQSVRLPAHLKHQSHAAANLL